MKQLYQRNAENCKLVKASPETIRFLTAFSRSLKIVKYRGVNFESHQN
jgi:hypothetical protein